MSDMADGNTAALLGHMDKQDRDHARGERVDDYLAEAREAIIDDGTVVDRFSEEWRDRVDQDLFDEALRRADYLTLAALLTGALRDIVTEAETSKAEELADSAEQDAADEAVDRAIDDAKGW